MATNVGIDVSKHTLEWSVGCEGRIQRPRHAFRYVTS